MRTVERNDAFYKKLKGFWNGPGLVIVAWIIAGFAVALAPWLASSYAFVDARGAAEAGYAPMEQTGTSPLSAFNGIYLGFSASEDSPVIIGEIEITVTDAEVRMRFATGTRIREASVATSIFVPMTTDEVAKFAQEYHRITGFRDIDDTEQYPKFFFLHDPGQNEVGLYILHGDWRDQVAPTTLFTPSQISRGDYDKWLKDIEITSRNAGRPFLSLFPRLHNGGRPEVQSNETGMEPR